MLARVGIAAGIFLLFYVALLLWRRPPRRRSILDLASLGVQGPAIIQFTTRFCAPCKLAAPRLRAAAESLGLDYAQLDLGERPEVARRYHIRTVPTIIVTDGRGRPLGVWTTVPTDAEIMEIAQRAGREEGR